MGSSFSSGVFPFPRSGSRGRLLVRTIWLALAVCWGAPAPALAEAASQVKGPPVQQVIEKVQALYNGTKDLKGKFKQVYTDTLYNRRRVSYGYLYVKKPGMMRWNYVQPERKSFIADGKELWVWEPEDKQAFHNPLSTGNLSTGLTFLLGQGDLAQEFDVAYSEEKLGSPEDLVLRLTPKKPTAQYKHLLMVIRQEDFVVTESVVVGKYNRNHILFSKLKFNTGLGTHRFRFKPGADVKVIDGSKLGGQ